MHWAEKLSRAYRVEDGKKFRLEDHDPGDTAVRDKDGGAPTLGKGLERLRSSRRSSMPTILERCS